MSFRLPSCLSAYSYQIDLFSIIWMPQPSTCFASLCPNCWKCPSWHQDICSHVDETQWIPVISQLGLAKWRTIPNQNLDPDTEQPAARFIRFLLQALGISYPKNDILLKDFDSFPLSIPFSICSPFQSTQRVDLLSFPICPYSHFPRSSVIKSHILRDDHLWFHDWNAISPRRTTVWFFWLF
jgi:hypothetical protein